MRVQHYNPNPVPQPKNAYEWRVFLFSHLDKPVPLNWNSNSQHQRKTSGVDKSIHGKHDISGGNI